jgi:hypothetical protein
VADTSLGRAIYELITDDSKLKKGLDNAHDDVVARTKKIGASIQKVGVGMTAAITAPFVLFAKSAIEGASSTEESLSKVRVVFKETAGDIEAFAKAGAKNLGLSNQAALEAAGTFGNLFSAMGITTPAAAGMSKSVLQLAADLASFNNQDPTEVLQKLRSGLTGETEPLKSLGVNLTAARVAAEAMSLGLVQGVQNMGDLNAANMKVETTTLAYTAAVKKHGKESIEARSAAIALEKAEDGLDKAIAGRMPVLDAAAKATATLSLITKDTALAAGDFARTSDGLANSQRIAKAEMEDMTAEMGKALLPIMTEGVKIIRNVLKAFNELSPEMKNTILVVVGIVAAIGPLLIVFGTILTMLPAIGVALTVLGGPIGLIILAIVALAGAWASNMGDIQGKTSAAVAFLQNAFDGVRLFILNAWRGIVLGISGAVNGIIGIINGFIERYNVLAEKLGLPLIGKIELLTPNLAAVDAEIDRITQDRHARIYLHQITVGAGGNALTEYAAGTDHITRGPELFLAGEAGPERVQVTPLANSIGRMPDSGGGWPAPGSPVLVRLSLNGRVFAEAMAEAERSGEVRFGR